MDPLDGSDDDVLSSLGVVSGDLITVLGVEPEPQPGPSGGQPGPAPDQPEEPVMRQEEEPALPAPSKFTNAYAVGEHLARMESRVLHVEHTRGAHRFETLKRTQHDFCAKVACPLGLKPSPFRRFRRLFCCAGAARGDAGRV